MPSSSENKEFTDEIMVVWPLDTALEWIRKNMSPEEVFEDTDALEVWAKENASKGLLPSEVFPEAELIEWAEDNGYIDSTALEAGSEESEGESDG